MYFVSREGVKNLETGEIVKPGTPEWDAYKQWVAEGNEPEYDPTPYEASELIRSPFDESQ
jgi:hypothetical protein